VGLTPLHEVPVGPSFTQWRFLGPLLLLVVVTVVLVWQRRRLPGLLGAWLHAAVVVAPVSGLAHSGSQLVSDRYSYLAALGWALVGGYAVAYVAGLRRRGRVSVPVAAVGAAGVALLIGVLAVGTWTQSGIWHDSETLWRWATEEDPACAMCEAILGEAIVYGSPNGRARLDEGESHVRRAIALRPTMPLPHYTLGTMRLARGQYAEAEASLRMYMQLAPALGQGPARLALVYLVQGRTSEAIPWLRRARELDRLPALEPRPVAPTDAGDPALPEAVRLMDGRWEDLEYLGEALLQQGQARRALVPLEAAQALAPDASGPRVWLVQAYEATGQRERAREAQEALRRIDPAAAGRLSVH
jgi:tetratricopeptide (TPR) repeat protein